MAKPIQKYEISLVYYNLAIVTRFSDIQTSKVSIETLEVWMSENRVTIAKL